MAGPDQKLPKVAYIMRSYPVLYQATVFNEIRFLQRRGYEIDVFSLLEVDPAELRRDSISDLPKATYCWTSRQSYASVAKANAAIMTQIGMEQYQAAFRFAQDARILGNAKSFARFAAHAYSLKRQGINHLHAHWATEATSVALLFAWLTGLPFSFTAHAYDIFLQPEFLSRKLAEASFAATVSAYNKRYMAENFGPQFESKINVIYPLIDLSQFTLRAAPPDNGLLSIISVGRLTSYKGLIFLVEACRILQERGVKFECKIVGEGEDRPMLEAAISAHNLRDSVKLLGSLPYEQIPPLLEQATLFALPCVIAHNGDRDGMPLVLIEAMARGLPVVSSNTIGLPELVRPEVGVLVPPHNPEALANAMLEIHQAGPARQREMGLAGRQIIETEIDAAIGAAKMAALFEAIYNGDGADMPVASVEAAV